MFFVPMGFDVMTLGRLVDLAGLPPQRLFWAKGQRPKTQGKDAGRTMGEYSLEQRQKKVRKGEAGRPKRIRRWDFDKPGTFWQIFADSPGKTRSESERSDGLNWILRIV